jgi:cytochrome c-type biogenesis protein CcmH
MRAEKFPGIKPLFWSLIWLAIILLVFIFMVSNAFAQEPTPTETGQGAEITDDQVNAIAKQLYCPVCENIPLDVCPTQACAQWRELIREKLAAGWSEKQIEDYFVEQYGARVLGVPPAQGVNWLVYVVPPVVILVGVFILFKAFRAWRPSLTQTAASPSQARVIEDVQAEASSPTSEINRQQPDEYVKRLEEELRKRG